MVIFRRLLRYLWPYWKQVLGGLVCMLIAQPLTLLHPLFWMFVVDELLLSDQPRFVEHFGQSRELLLLGVLGVMLLAQSVGTWVGALRDYLHGVVAQRVGFDMRNQLYAKFQEHSLSFFHSRRSGDLVSRATGDIETVQQVATNGVDEVIGSALQLVLVWGIIFALNWQVAVSLLVPMSAVGLMIWRFNRRIRPLYRAVRDRLGDVSAKMQENLLGMLVIKAFGREAGELQRVVDENHRYYGKAVESIAARARFSPMVQTVGFLSNVVMLGVGAYYVMRGLFTIGQLTALRGYWWQLFAPIWTLARVNDMVQRAIAAGDRVFEIMDAPVEITDAPDAVALEHARGELTLQNVTFQYEGTDRPVLAGIDAQVAPGEMLGVVGPSGAGKSTLLGLLLRFYDPQGGSLRLDGHDLRSLTQESLRRQMGVVTQDPFLFNAPVRENILFGDPQASDERLFAAARAAHAHEFILNLPQGYDTIVGERGVKLSGGQKQRICIARAFLANPRVLLLDEATSAVEPESEAIIQQALEQLMAGRTSVVISHRLSMVRGARQIIVIRDGQITERGSHETLMARDDWYARMYRLQMGNGERFGT